MEYLGVYVGKVVGANESGKYQILVESVHGNLKPSQYNLLDWVKYSSTLEVGDRVVVVFEDGNKYRPVCLRPFK